MSFVLTKLFKNRKVFLFLSNNREVNWLSHTREKRAGFVCSVCERTEAPVDRLNVLICKNCAHPKRVRVYFQCCKIRLDLSLQDAQKLFSRGGMYIWRTGVNLRFKECPDCAENDMAQPDIFTIHVPDSELEFSSSVAQC